MLALLLAAIQPLTCSLIHADAIFGRDLAAAVPAFSAISPDVRIGLSPAPGLTRTLGAAELKRIALANHLEAQVTQDICFAWKMTPPDPKKMIAAMQRTLADRNPAIEVVESSLMPVPEGEIFFPVSGLIVSSDSPSVWRGYVLYSGTKKFPIWARAFVRVKEQHVVASADLREGDALRLDQLKLETYQGPVSRDRYVTNPSKIEGFLLRRPIAAGAPLMEDMLETPREVNRGETVDAIVQTGAARLDVQGIAEDDGRKGQVISIRNPRSGRTFHARVEDKGVVVVVPGGQFGLVVEAKKS